MEVCEATLQELTGQTGCVWVEPMLENMIGPGYLTFYSILLRFLIKYHNFWQANRDFSFFIYLLFYVLRIIKLERKGGRLI